MESLFVARVRKHIEDLARRSERYPDAHSFEHRPLTEVEVQSAETRLGFTLPSSLRLLYRQVGNGRYGPAYGLLGLIGAAQQEDGYDALRMYESGLHRDPQDPHWNWPEKLLPVVHLGCAMFFLGGLLKKALPGERKRRRFAER